MSPDRWERIQDLFHRALDQPEAERETFVQAHCEGDAALAAEVLALLESDRAGHPLLDAGLGVLADRIIDDEEADPHTPRQFGPYRVVRKLGEGGMGVVFLAERPDLNSRAAIKVLRDAWVAPTRRERFVAEQRLLVQLNHPSIARLYDSGTLADGTPWFVMEYVDGVPLMDAVRSRRLSLPERLDLFRAVCEAVLHAHQHAVIHRDLKPSNILVTPDGTVKLLDFGIGKQLTDPIEPADRTRTGFRLMTPAYAAPEQLVGGQVGVHTDIYALGVILYELLCGELPFDLTDRTPGQAEALIAQQAPAKPSAMARKTTGNGNRTAVSAGHGAWNDLDVLCLTAMHKDPARRYRSVDALIRDVDHFLKDEPIEARPDSFGYRWGKFARRNWKPLAAAALVAVAIVSLVAFYTMRLVSARNDALSESRRSERVQQFMTDLFQGGDPEAGAPESLRVVSLLDRGFTDARSLEAEPAVQSDLYLTLGSIRQAMGNLDLADTLLARSLETGRHAFGPDHPDVARRLVAMGVLRTNQSRFDEADSLIRSGLAILDRNERRDPETKAGALGALGFLLENRGEYDTAIVVLEDALQLQENGGIPEKDRSATLTEIANCHYYAGRYAVSDSLNRVVLTMDRRLYGSRHPHVAADLVNIGAIQFDLGQPVEAERYYREALAIYETWYGRDHYETASMLTMIARALISQEKNPEATALLEQSLAIRTRIYGEESPSVASTLNELSRLAQGEGRLDDAITGYTRVVGIYRKAYGGKHQHIGIALANLGGAYTARGDYRLAESTLRDALAIYAETLPPDHLYVGIARIKLGRALLRADRPRDAELESRAGYDIVRKQDDFRSGWLINARHDLVEEYDAMGNGAAAARFRAELADTSDGSGGKGGS